MCNNPRIGTLEYYKKRYEIEKDHWWCKGTREVNERILNALFQGTKGFNILDAGCGTGINLTWLQKYSLPKKAVAIDKSLYALEFCLKRGEFSLSQASILELPFKNESFDLVTCIDVIQHLPQNGSDKLALGELYRVLKQDGCLLLQTNSSQGMGKEAKSADENYRMYCLNEVRDLLKESGFHVIRITYANILLSIIPTVRRYLTYRKDKLYYTQGLPLRQLSPHLEWLRVPYSIG